MKKIVSFDVWHTLLIKKENHLEIKSKLINDFLGTNIQPEIIQSCSKSVIKTFNSYMDIFGVQPCVITCWTAIIKELGYNKIIDVKELREFSKIYSQTICENGFEYRDTSVKNVLQNLSDIIVPTITSNTLLLFGNDILNFFTNENITFKKPFFSDQYDYCKPALKCWHNRNINCHIGDNIIVDGSCQDYAISFLHLNKNTTLCELLNSH